MKPPVQLLDHTGRPFQKEKRSVRFSSSQFDAKYDAAATNAENRRHWPNADGNSPATSNSPAIRKTLRERARYERDNDPHLNGLIKTLAYDLIGTGPRLQLKFDESKYEQARAIEASWSSWCRAVGLADKLRILHEARPVDGESFAVLTTNPLVNHPVKLDLQLVEAEMITGGENTEVSATEDDGIKFDKNGNPISYRKLKTHPGDATSDDAEDIPAQFMIHWFRATRPGQRRGASELASCLPIGAQTRRYAQAVLTAAEFAAMLAGVMHTNGSANVDEVPTVESLDEIDMVRGALLTLPEGWDAKQFDAKHPTGTYKDFVADKRNEIARPVLAPFNVISGNSSGYNYSSGRLDHVPYHRSVWIERDRMRSMVVDRIFMLWLEEASPAGIIDGGLPPFEEWVWDWHWDGFQSIDPNKDAAASELRLNLGLTTLSEECAAEGKDWRDVLTQRAAEKEYAKSLGLVLGNGNGAMVAGPDGEDGSSALVPVEGQTAQQTSTAKKAATGADVQATALNGAQITSLILICDKIPTKQYPPEGAQAIIEAAFPLMDRALVSAFVKALAKHKPPTPPELATPPGGSRFGGAGALFDMGTVDDTDLDLVSREAAHV